MFIKAGPRAQRGWTLPEMMVAVGIFSLSSLVMMGLWLFCIRGFASMYNYAFLDQHNRQAMDQLTREIRQAKQVVGYTTNSITIQTANPDGSTGPQVSYQFDPISEKLLRTVSDGTTQLLLDNCSLLNFQLYTRCPSNASFGVFPVAVNNWSNTVKVIQLTWKTTITTPTCVGISEDVQTARIVIRKQQD
jgi:prepilin-type N-terminal cleavage/methylation domain-containing protein